MSTALTVITVLLLLCQAAAAQRTAKSVAASTSYDHDRAIELVRQQIDATKTFDDRTQRIRVLIRAADLLWPYQEQQARTAFTNAFELASSDFEERRDKPTTETTRATSSQPDSRYLVISAIAKRDAAWARKLTEKMLKDESQEAEQAATKDRQRDTAIAPKLLDAAFVLLPSDIGTAISFARRSLSYPATVELPMFLYKLAELNQSNADELYREALAAYGDKPMAEFLYLSAYPFGNDREAGDMPSYALYHVPSAFVSNKSLQYLFLHTLLRRAQQMLQTPTDTGGSGYVGDTGQVWLALTRLEPQVGQSLPDLLSAVQQARENIYTLLSQDSRLSLKNSIASQNVPKRTFDEQVEVAEKQSNSDKRDQLLVLAIIRASDAETVDHVVDIAGKISNSTTRQQVLDWLYFVRSQSALKNAQVDEARRLASKVEELDQRAYLYSEIARESLKILADQTQTRELLDDVVASAGKAPNTIVTARTLLAAAYLYANVDINRSVSVLGDAIKCINRLEMPDFSRDVVIRKIEGKTFGTYAVFQTPGFTPESTLREIGTVNLDSALSQASSFTDKSLRSLTILALADLWLARLERERKEERTKKTKI